MIAKTLSRLGIEVWKDIPEYEGLYQASNLGNIRSLNYHRSGGVKNLILSKNSKNRFHVILCNYPAKKKFFYVHQLLAFTFLRHKPNGHNIVIDHIDNNPLNNNLYNLQLITQRENLSKDKKGTSKHTGVSWNKKRNKWRGQIFINGKARHLGYFTNEKEAAQAYQNELNKIKL